jgi:hypothetical protein
MPAVAANLVGISFEIGPCIRGGPAMLDAMQETITATTLELLKRKPSAVDAERWVPRLVHEIERLRSCLADAEERGAS